MASVISKPMSEFENSYGKPPLKGKTDSTTQTREASLASNDEETKYFCCGVDFSKVCNYLNCCGQWACCVNKRETVINVVVKEEELVKEESLTEDGFFAELQGKYIEEYFLMTLDTAICFIEDKFPKEAPYWRQWKTNPQSGKQMEAKKVRFFRELMQEAYTSMSEDRIDLMKHQLLHKPPKQSPSKSVAVEGGDRSKDGSDQESPKIRSVDVELRNIPLNVQDVFHTISQGSPASISPDGEIRVVPVLQAFDVTPNTSNDSSSLKEVLVVHMNAEIESFDSGKLMEDVTLITMCTEAEAQEVVNEVEEKLTFPCQYKNVWEQLKIILANKNIEIKKKIIDFKNQKIIDDMLVMTSCSFDEAAKIAAEIENTLKFPCHREDIWNQIKIEIEKRLIEVKEIVDVKLCQDLVQYMDDNGICKFREIPAEKFNELLKARREHKESPINQLEAAVVPKKTTLAKTSGCFHSKLTGGRSPDSEMDDQVVPSDKDLLQALEKRVATATTNV